MPKSCTTHVDKHFLQLRGYYAWCEDHGRLSLKTGRPSTTIASVFTHDKAAAEAAAAKHVGA